MYVTAIVLAAGGGLRFSHPNSFTVRGRIPTHRSKMIESEKSNISKPLTEINSKPIIIYSLGTLSRHLSVRDIIVVANAKNSGDILRKINQYKIDKVSWVVEGGRRRQDSVFNALKAMDKKTDLVLIHDGARPFIDKKIISSVIREARGNGAAITGVPVKATIKKVTRSPGHPACPAGRQVTRKLIVEKTLNRDNLWEIQTPQVFRKALILKAYKQFGNISVTDDSMLVEKLAAKVSVVLGSYSNIKITVPEDLILAEAIAKRWNTE